MTGDGHSKNYKFNVKSTEHFFARFVILLLLLILSNCFIERGVHFIIISMYSCRLTSSSI